MKFKAISLMTALVLSIGVLSACGAKTTPAAPTTPGAPVVTETAWPTKTVEVIVTASAGGDTDFNARTFAKYFEKITGETMIITNMPGGGGSVATSQVKNGKADGNTILFSHTGQLIVNEVAGLIDYNMDAFDIATIPAVDKGGVLVASKQSGIKTIEEFVTKAKAAPGTVIYGTELGGYSHLQGLIMQDIADIEMKIVDVGSSAEKITNLLGGRVDVAAIAYGNAKDYAATGDMVILAQFNEEKNELLGDIPTFKDGGIDFFMEKPYIISFPKGTDPKIIEKMNAVSAQIALDPDYAKDLDTGFKQPVDRMDTKEAIDHLHKVREDFFKYQSLLKK